MILDCCVISKPSDFTSYNGSARKHCLPNVTICTFCIYSKSEDGSEILYYLEDFVEFCFVSVYFMVYLQKDCDVICIAVLDGMLLLT